MNKRVKKTIANIIIIAMILCGAAWIASVFIHTGGEFTDNAQVEQDILTVNARVQGFIKRVYVGEYQHVHKGDTLLTIDDTEFRLHIAQAEAALAQAKAEKYATEKSVQEVSNQMKVNTAAIEEVKVLLANAKADYDRYRTLFEEEAVTQQELEQMQTRYESLKAKVETMEQQNEGTSITREMTTVRVEQGKTSIEAAEIAVEIAKLNLTYCTVIAPCDGYTAKKQVQDGELAMPGMKLFTIVSDQGSWVMANFRETQRGGIQVGNLVEMKIDAFKDHPFMGQVVKIANATGASFSPVAPDNSTGNYVKVEQRIPVKIAFTDDNDSLLVSQLSAGMNVECLVLPDSVSRKRLKEKMLKVMNSSSKLSPSETASEKKK